MPVLKDKDKETLTKVFSGLQHPVKLVMFTQEVECDFCTVTRELVTEVLDFVRDAGRAKEMGVDKIPAIAVLGERDYGIRFFGVPAGYELGTLIEAILDVGKRESALSAPVMAELAKIDRPVHLQVLVSPT
jgi:alkyl hydroperoxide reductase subunit AhpF